MTMIDPFTLTLIVIVALSLMGASVGLSMMAGSFIYLILKGFDPSIASETMLQGLFNNYTLLAIPFLGEKVKLILWIAILLGLAGVIVVLQPGRTELSLGHVTGFGAAVSLAATSISTRMIGGREHSTTLIVYPMMTMLLASGLAMIWLYQPLTGDALAILFAIGMLNVLGQALLVLAYRSSEAQFVAPVQYTQMLWAIFYGAVFFGEQVTENVILGSTVIILSGLLFVWREMVASVSKPILRTRNLRASAGPTAPPSESDRTRQAAEAPS